MASNFVAFANGTYQEEEPLGHTFGGNATRWISVSSAKVVMMMMRSGWVGDRAA
jgi:hypothetical protein